MVNVVAAPKLTTFIQPSRSESIRKYKLLFHAIVVNDDNKVKSF